MQRVIANVRELNLGPPSKLPLILSVVKLNGFTYSFSSFKDTEFIDFPLQAHINIIYVVYLLYNCSTSSLSDSFWASVETLMPWLEFERGCVCFNVAWAMQHAFVLMHPVVGLVDLRSLIYLQTTLSCLQQTQPSSGKEFKPFHGGTVTAQQEANRCELILPFHPFHQRLHSRPGKPSQIC